MDSLGSVIALAKAGAGVALVPDFIFEGYRERNELVALCPDYVLPAVPIYSLHAFGSNPPSAVKWAIEFIKEMKTIEATKNIPVIILSSLDDTDTAIQCLEIGAKEFLHKPVPNSILFASVKRALALSVSQDRMVSLLASSPMAICGAIWMAF